MVCHTNGGLVRFPSIVGRGYVSISTFDRDANRATVIVLGTYIFIFSTLESLPFFLIV